MSAASALAMYACVHVLFLLGEPPRPAAAEQFWYTNSNLSSCACGTSSGSWLLCHVRYMNSGVAGSCAAILASVKLATRSSSYTQPLWLACEHVSGLTSCGAGALSRNMSRYGFGSQNPVVCDVQ